MSQLAQVQIQDTHRENFERNRSTISKFYKLDERSLQLIEVHQRLDGVHSYCEFLVRDGNGKTATLKVDTLRTKTNFPEKDEQNKL